MCMTHPMQSDVTVAKSQLIPLSFSQRLAAVCKCVCVSVCMCACTYIIFCVMRNTAQISTII